MIGRWGQAAQGLGSWLACVKGSKEFEKAFCTGALGHGVFQHTVNEIKQPIRSVALAFTANN